MMLDAHLQFSAAQVVNANANSTNHIDAGATRALDGVMSGSELEVLAVVKAQSGTNPSVQVKLVGADTDDFGTGKVDIAESPVLVSPGVGKHIRVPVPPQDAATRKRYYRLEYVTGGTTPNFTLDAYLGVGRQTAGI